MAKQRHYVQNWPMTSYKQLGANLRSGIKSANDFQLGRTLQGKQRLIFISTGLKFGQF